MQIDKCLECTRKHVRQAAVCYLEMHKGIEDKWDMAIGHLAEASDAIVLINEDVGIYIRDQYKRLENDHTIDIDFNAIFIQLDTLFDAANLWRPGR